jgi:hypothetical protein
MSNMLHTYDPKVADTEEFGPSIARCKGRMVQQRAPVEHRRFVREYTHARGILGCADARRRDWRKFSRRDYSRRLSGARRNCRIRDRHDARTRARTRLRISPQSGDRSTHQHAQSLGRPDSGDQEVSQPSRDRPVGRYGDRGNGDQFTAIGKWRLTIHDNTRPYQPWEKPFCVLSSGDVYNMKTRSIEKYGNGSPVSPPVIEGSAH